MKRKLIKLEITKLEFDMIIVALMDTTNHYEDVSYETLAKTLKDMEK